MPKLVRKKIKRRPGVKSKNYFTESTDKAIEKWQGSDSDAEKDKLFADEIMPAFTALVDNLVWVYGFKCPRENADAMKADCVTFLYESLHKWDPERGTKAFSYYNITAKRWLINQSKKYIKRARAQVSADDDSTMTPMEKYSIESKTIVQSPDSLVTQEEMNLIIGKLMYELELGCKNDRQVLVANAIKYLFDNIEQVDIMNKRSILVYLREITGLEQNQLSSALSSIRRNYRDVTGGNGIFAYEFWED